MRERDYTQYLLRLGTVVGVGDTILATIDDLGGGI